MARVLLVDDDEELAAMLREYLGQEGFEVTAVGDGEAGVSEALSERRRLRPEALHASRAGGAAPGHPPPLGSRGAPGGDGSVSVGPLTLWGESRRAEWAGSAIDLTSTEFNLLALLAERAGRVVSRAELSEKALGRSLGRYDRSIDVHVFSLRQKIGLGRGHAAGDARTMGPG